MNDDYSEFALSDIRLLIELTFIHHLDEFTLELHGVTSNYHNEMILNPLFS